MADEYGYLGAARRILGDGPQTHVPYRVGAALLYLPATALTGDAIGRVPGRAADERDAGRRPHARGVVDGGPVGAAARAVAALCGRGRGRALHVVPRLLQPGRARDRVRGARPRAGRRTGPRRPRATPDVVGAGRRGLRCGVAAASARRRRDRGGGAGGGARAVAARPAPPCAGRLRGAGGGRDRRHRAARQLGDRPGERPDAVQLGGVLPSRRQRRRPPPDADQHLRAGVLPQRRDGRPRDAGRAGADPAAPRRRAGPAGAAVPARDERLRGRHLRGRVRARAADRLVPVRSLQRVRRRTAAAGRAGGAGAGRSGGVAAGATSPRPAASRSRSASSSTCWPGRHGSTTACTRW